MKKELLHQQKIGKLIKKCCQVLVLFAFMLNATICLSEERVYKPSPDQAARYIKLGNSYRELESYDFANFFIKKGMDLAKKQNNKYWEACGYEFLAYVDIDNSDIPNAIDNLKKALDIYKDKINMVGGSQDVIMLLIARLEQGIVGGNITKLNELQERIDMLLEENKQLKEDNIDLQNKLNVISTPGPN